MAMLAAAITRCHVKDPSKVKIDDFLLKFVDPAETKKVPQTEGEKKAHIANSKIAWMSCTGLGVSPKNYKAPKKKKS